jgi:formylglycine-generating enzyme required for sulfatase activity/protein-S-isoprenylcysteine O-methyltransferase Ste14
MLWLRTLLFTILVPGTVLVLVPLALVASSLGPHFDFGPAAYSGLVPLLAGLSVIVACFIDFVRRGRGTPAPYDPPRQLVITGLYRYVRNPQYVGVVLVVVGGALLSGAAVLFGYAAFLAIAYHLLVRYYEEPTLSRLFGEAYARYREAVPRWLPDWPGVAALVIAVAAFTGLTIWNRFEEKQKANRAAGLVQAVLNADIAQVPTIVDQMAEYRQWADPLLREENSKAADKSRQKLHTSLALLPVDASQAPYLKDRLLDAQAGEVAVIRDALFPHKDQLVGELWAVVESPKKGKESQRLRAAAALAKHDPESEKWAKASVLVVHDLVQQNPVYLLYWSEAFRPVRAPFLAPLSEVYRDHRPEQTAERSLATYLLADYAADNPHALAELLMDADERQFGAIFPVAASGLHASPQGRPLVATLLTGEIDKKLAADLPSSDDRREKLAKQQVNAAVALFRLSQPEKVWPLLKRTPADDPRVRSYLIHRLGPLGADVGAILKRLDEEQDTTIRRALLLSLGQFSDEQLPADARSSRLQKLKAIYHNEADPGLHAAAEWLLRRWQQEEWLKRENERWAKQKEERDDRLAGIRQLLARDKEKTPLQWYVNGQGQTMVVIPGPVEFVMGSPLTEKGRRRNDEFQHRKRIGRTFALGAAPVTKELFLRFQPSFSHSEIMRYPLPTCPIGGVTWYEAAAYCNWLSKEEGIPENQWCYETDARGQVVKLKEHYLSLTGYRLPTETEWEYACRAGAATSRCYGETAELQTQYGWNYDNTPVQTQPVGTLKPNDWGLFDMQGNVANWCQERHKPYAADQGKPIDDIEDTLDIISTDYRVLRGGSFLYAAVTVRSADRMKVLPSYWSYTVGFHPARTIAP